jgi:hypothetical protein
METTTMTLPFIEDIVQRRKNIEVRIAEARENLRSAELELKVIQEECSHSGHGKLAMEPWRNNTRYICMCDHCGKEWRTD